MTACRIEMLGGFRVRLAEGTVERFRTRKTAMLLALLALHRSRMFPREEVIELIWPEASEESGRNSLRIALSSLKKTLGSGGEPFRIHRAAISLNEELVATDVRDFERFVKSGDKLGEALSLYRGELLPGLHSEWIVTERARMADLYLSALQQLGRAHLESREYERAIDLAHQAMRADPFSEESYRLGIQAQLELGRIPAAYETYRRLKTVLGDELGIEPSKETKALISKFEPPKTVALTLTPSSRRRTIEPPASRFFGREEELMRLRALASTNRLVTVTGPGGVGKTRIAVELAASENIEEVARCWFVSLAQCSTADAMLAAIATAVAPGQTGPEPLDRLRSFLLADPSLLVLDNLEQAADSAREAAIQLLSHFPKVRILATSRIPLDVLDEQIFLLEPLPVPANGPTLVASLLQSPAVQLFVDRIRAVQPGFQLEANQAEDVASLMAILEGLPLALELAAARSRMLSVREMLEHAGQRLSLLNDPRSSDSRHRSLKAALDWSYSLLSDPEKDLLAALSIFQSGWTLEGAQAIYPESNVLDGIDALIRDSLVSSQELNGATRFRMLETVREYASAKLEEPKRRLFTRAHAAHYLQLAQRAAPHLEGAEQGSWISLLESEFANIRAAQRWFVESGRKKELQLFLASLWPYLARFCSLAESRLMLDTVVGGEDFSVEDSIGLRLLEGVCKLAEMHCDFEQATLYAEKGLEASRCLKQPAFEVEFLGELGVLSKRKANLPEAERFWNEAYRVAKESGKVVPAARCLTSLATLARLNKDVSRARRLFGEALAAFESDGDPHKISIALQNLGLLECDEGDYEASIVRLRQALEIRYEINDLKGIAFSLGALGQTLLAADRFDEAAGYYSECLDLCFQLDNRIGLEHCLWDLSHAFAKRGCYDFAARMFGALERAYTDTGIELQYYEQEEWIQAMDALNKSLGEGAVVRLMAQGRSLTLVSAAKEMQAKLAL